MTTGEFSEELTPRQIVAELDKYIVGQASAKRAVAVALRNRYRRRQLPEDIRDEVIPKNILMIGPTGVGKTEIARRLASLARAPFIKVEATKFTEVGYMGRDVDSMIRDLVQEAIRLVEAERLEEVREAAAERAIDRVVDILQPAARSAKAGQPSAPSSMDFGEALRNVIGPLIGSTDEHPRAEAPPVDSSDTAEEESRRNRIRERLRQRVAAGTRDEDRIDISVDESAGPQNLQIMPMQGADEMGVDLREMLGGMLQKRTRKRNVTIAEARQIFAQEEAKALVDRDSLVREAVRRAEQTGIVFVDEIDKIAGPSRGAGVGGGPDVSREGVQRDILPIIEGSTVNTKYGPVRTDHMLFIAAGAFHISKPSDLMPELQGRLPIRVELDSLTEADFKRILTEPRNALTRQYTALLETEGVTVTFSDEGVEELARVAADVNHRSENIGARRLHTILERVLEDVSFEAPEMDGKALVVDREFVVGHLSDIMRDEDLGRYIL